jgi:sugar O-acyltransferase (sialic acid O-acetyltransferase NeuD family)
MNIPHIKSKRLIIVGDGETAMLAYEYFIFDSDYEVVAFSVEQKYLNKRIMFDLPVVPFETIEAQFSPNEFEIFIAISHTQLNRLRTRLYKLAKEKGYCCASYISSHAFVWRNVQIGENCFVLENNVIQYNVKIGNNVTLWSGNHIGHQTTINDNCFLSSHVVVSGYCVIGENCFLGVNSCLANNLEIASDCFIGMGAIINQNTEKGKIYNGNPALPHKISVYKVFNIPE